MKFTITVSDLRQFEYCQRIVYFSYCLGLSRRRPTTYKMEEGSLLHEQVAELEERRSLHSYGLQEGERHFDVRLRSEKLGLSGLLDMLIITSKEAIPVEFKNSSSAEVGANHKAQLAAYALLIEEQRGVSVSRSFIHFIPARQSIEVILEQHHKSAVLLNLERIRHMVERENMPEATLAHGRCTDCEFRNFCPDVW
ncbi:CRISPR-associated protein Cas4 [Candidatus Chlorohelix sp.]|uniref:CRISPR-associated protein Cas4 n=1 Tax=Candidatus Chlorohelix sp. TaxID=3139201 RepID=UPI00302583CA